MRLQISYLLTLSLVFSAYCWNNEEKTVLITGGAGFIGHHVIEGLLTTTSWNLICLDRLDFSGNLNRIADMLTEKDMTTRRRLKFVYVDLRSPVSEGSAGDIGKVDYILHLAAGSHVDRSIEYPMEFVMDNVVGTVNILEFARKYQPDLDRFVYFSTDEVFGKSRLVSFVTSMINVIARSGSQGSVLC